MPNPQITQIGSSSTVVIDQDQPMTGEPKDFANADIIMIGLPSQDNPNADQNFAQLHQMFDDIFGG